MDEVNIRNSDLKNIKNELHQMNVFMGHICEILDSLIAEKDKLDTSIHFYHDPNLKFGEPDKR